jgi:uncharacterized phage protein gp47/JayE
MTTTFPLATLAATVTAAGISAPPYADIFSSLQASFQLIYGQDIYLGSDSQDGQALGIIAKAVNDCNNVAIFVYNQLSPATAIGAGLSSIVKINGIQRQVASNSSVDLLIGGNVGIPIVNGIVTDTLGQAWLLPALVTIPGSGSITVTATAQNPGALNAAIGTCININNPQFGWQTATNPTAASPGAPVELDPALRQRQALSVANPSQSVLEGIAGAIANLTGVTEIAAYENDTGSTDANGLPPHSISLVVQGGDATEIATQIMIRKTPGCSTYGSTTIFVTDTIGITHQINFYTPSYVPIQVQITINALTGYSANTGVAIQQAVANYISSLSIGDIVMVQRLSLPAQLFGAGAFNTFELTSIEICVLFHTLATLDVPIAFNQQATCVVANVALVVT